MIHDHWIFIYTQNQLFIQQKEREKGLKKRRFRTPSQNPLALKANRTNDSIFQPCHCCLSNTFVLNLSFILSINFRVSLFCAIFFDGCIVSSHVICTYRFMPSDPYRTHCENVMKNDRKKVNNESR